MEIIRRDGWKPMMNRFMAQFGTRRTVPEGDAQAAQRIREVYHDLRGGALSITHMRIELSLMKGTGVKAGSLQIAYVANLVKPNEYAALVDRFGDDLRGLFEGGFTIGGSGVGLKVVSETVANAYGLTSAAAATDGGHVGARLIGEEIVVWAHWPVME